MAVYFLITAFLVALIGCPAEFGSSTVILLKELHEEGLTAKANIAGFKFGLPAVRDHCGERPVRVHRVPAYTSDKDFDFYFPDYAKDDLRDTGYLDGSL